MVGNSASSEGCSDSNPWFEAQECEARRMKEEARPGCGGCGRELDPRINSPISSIQSDTLRKLVSAVRAMDKGALASTRRSPARVEIVRFVYFHIFFVM